jgi:hypothetical protein
VEQAERERAVFRCVVGAVEADVGGDVVDGDGERGHVLAGFGRAGEGTGGEYAVVGECAPEREVNVGVLVDRAAEDRR